MNLFEIEKDDIHSKFSDYFLFQSILGFGSFGVVVSAIAKSTRQECAVKIIHKKNLNSEEFDSLRDEAYILASLKHPNIVRFKEIKETDTKILIAMELVHGGHLKSLMNEYKQKGKWFSESEIALIMKTILKAIEYIHDKSIVHRDIKPENILIENKEDFSSLKIADFGLSAQFGRSNMSKIMTQQCGTIIFMAPEQLSNKIYSKPVDVWSCGILMYMLLAKGEHPLYKADDSIKRFVQKLNHGFTDFPSNLNISAMAKNLFQKLVQKDPAERYSADKALIHPWITGNFKDQVPLTTNEIFQSFEKEQNFIKTIKTLYFIGFCLQSDNSLNINPRYKEFIKKESPITRNKEFSLEKNYIDALFNFSEITTKTKSPPKNKKNIDNTVIISHFITQKINKDHFHFRDKRNLKNEIIEFNNETLKNEIKNDNDNSKLTGGQTPTDSKDTNTTLNSTQRRTAKTDFIVKICKKTPERIEHKTTAKKNKTKRATSANLKNKFKKMKQNMKNNEIKINQEIEETKSKQSIEMPKSSTNITEISKTIIPKRHFSITPISGHFDNIKSKIFRAQKSNIILVPREEKENFKSETYIPHHSPLPTIKTLIPKNYLFKKEKNIIQPNGKCLAPNEYTVKKPITLTLNPPASKYTNKRIRFRKKLI